MGIDVLDHVIIGDGIYVSMREKIDLKKELKTKNYTGFS